MANDRYNQFIYSKIPMLTLLQANVTIGATGAVEAVAGKNLSSVTRLAQGIYRVKFTQNYPQFVSFDGNAYGGVTGNAVTAGSFVTGTLYQIVTLGTTTQAQWVTAGLDAEFTAAVGMPFVAAAAGAGTGTVKAIGASGVTSIELAQDPTKMLTNLLPGQNKGASFIIRTMGPTDSTTTTPIAVDPAAGAKLNLKFWLSNSSVSNY